jgi:hypothetical protein
MRPENTRYNGEVELRILREMKQRSSCTVDELVRAFPDYTWNQVFRAIDRLIRDGALFFRRPNRFEYVVETGHDLQTDWLGDQDSNLGNQIQSLMSYH